MKACKARNIVSSTPFVKGGFFFTSLLEEGKKSDKVLRG